MKRRHSAHISQRQLTLSLAMLICGIAGSILLWSSHADTPSTSLQPSEGTLSGPARKLTDTTATGGQSVKFGIGANGISGERLPVGNLPGWTQIFTEDFNTNVPLGSGFPANHTAYTSWRALKKTLLHKDLARATYYDNQRTVSVRNSMLDIFMHTEDGQHLCAQFRPILNTPDKQQIYGRYSVRYRADPVAGYGGVWLLWANPGPWPDKGEIDYPEAAFSGTMEAHAHYANPKGGQDNFDSNVSFGGWHTATTEWKPNQIQFFLDGRLIGTSTKQVPSTSMYFNFQCGIGQNWSAPPDDAQGHMQVDWVSIYSYTP